MNGNATTADVRGSAATSDTVIGLELGVRKSRACVLRRGDAIEEIVMPSTKAGLRFAFEPLERCRIFMEVGPTSPWVSRFLTELGFDAVVIVPSTLKEMLGKRQKTDRDDALGLARLGARCPDLLRRVTHRSESTQRRMALLRMRDGLVRARTLLVNEVRGVLAALGIPAPPCSARAFARRTWNHLSPDDRLLVRSSLRQITALTAEIHRIERDLEQIAQAHYAAEMKVLTQPAGVGKITALAFILAVEDPKRFKRNRAIGSYLGVVPRRKQSGDLDPQLSITKTGNPYLRRLLVHCAQYMLGRFGRDCDLRRFGLAICERGGPRAKKRAVVAVARRLAVLLLSLWKSGATYQPLRHSAPPPELATA